MLRGPEICEKYPIWILFAVGSLGDITVANKQQLIGMFKIVIHFFAIEFLSRIMIHFNQHICFRSKPFCWFRFQVLLNKHEFFLRFSNIVEIGLNLQLLFGQINAYTLVMGVENIIILYRRH